MQSLTEQPRISVVVPLLNEEDNVRPLATAVGAALDGRYEWELLLVDDGSQDRTAERAREVCEVDPARIRLLRLARNFGQTAAMQAGFDHARGDIVVSLDGDMQNDPADIPRLVERVRAGYDLVVGYRVRRKDRFIARKIPSWVANRLIQWLTGIPIRDNGCSLKAYRRDLLDRLDLYAELHRFIPAVAVSTAGARVSEIPVRHHPRRFGESKYGLSRVLKVLADIVSVTMIRSFRKRPLHLFGLAAAASLALALSFAMAAAIAYLMFQPVKADALVFPAVALMAFGLGGYLLMLGLIAEVVVRVDERARPQPAPISMEVEP